jgi:4-amino-4-deoxy-L-arabinose transferase-like glycosyltransferase
LQHASIVARVFAVRLVSLAFGLLAVLCTFGAARRILDDSWMAFAAAACVALQPVASQQTAAVSNDAALIGLGALLFYLQVRVLAAVPTPPSVRLCIAIGAASGLVLMTKPQAVALLPGSVVVLAVAFWRRWRAPETWIRLGAALAAALALAVPALFELKRSLRAFAVLNEQQRGGGAAVGRGFVGWLLHFNPRLSDHLFSSFWARFAWMECRMEPEWFGWLHTAISIGAIGLVLGIGARLTGLGARWWSARGLALCAGTVLLASGFLLYTEYYARARLGASFVTQGRNYFVVLPALAILTAIGFGACVPARARAAVAATLVSCAILLQVGALATVARYHYGN